MKLERLQKLAASRNVSTNRDRLHGLSHYAYLTVKPRLLLKNVDFSNRQRLKIS